MDKKRKQSGSDHGSRSKRPQKFKQAGIPRPSTGVLITTDTGREYKAANEVRNLLTEYYDKRIEASGTAGAGPSSTAAAAAAAAASGGGTIDIAAELAAEISQLKDRKSQNFHILDIGIRCLMYVQMKDPSIRPSALIEDYFAEAKRTGQAKTRHTIRFYPVEDTCFASVDDIVACVQKHVDREFPTQPDDAKASRGTFAIVWDSRNGPSSLKRNDVIVAVAKLIPEAYKVDLTNPDRAIFVQTIKSVCAIGFGSHFNEYAKWNIRQLLGDKAAPTKEEEEKGSGTSDEESEDDEHDAGK